MKAIKKIWQDDVFRTVIVNAIIVVCGFIVFAIFGVKDANGFNDLCVEFFTKEFILPIWSIILIVIVVSVITTIGFTVINKDSIKKRLVRHNASYITLRNDNALYCSSCWDRNKELISMSHSSHGVFECPVCKNRGCVDEQTEKVIRHSSPYITFSEEDNHIRYCSNCWDSNYREVVLGEQSYGHFECPLCKSTGRFDKDDIIDKAAPISIYKF